MLVSLSIRDIVVIDRLKIDLSDGLTAFTGETGAGKSILLDSLSLALGARGDAGLVRGGAEQGDVTAVFELAADHPALELLAERGIEDEGVLILRRVQSADGRSRAFVNDDPVSVGFLHDLGSLLVEIHGQHDDRAMADAATHRTLLDAFGGLEAKVAGVRGAFREWQAAVREHGRLKAAVETAEAEADYLRNSVEELRGLDPQTGEETELAGRRQHMMQAEKIAGELAEAHDAVAGNASSIPLLAGVIRRLERKAEEASGLLEAPIRSIDAALTALQEAETVLEGAVQDVQLDPRELERVEERLFALRAAGRKYNVAVDELGALKEKLESDLNALESGAEQLKVAADQAAQARSKYDELAAKLTTARGRAAKALAKSVTGELPDLKLERAGFMVELESDPGSPGESGVDAVSFNVQTNPGQKPGPLMKVASGGELARFMLALKVALADKGSAPTLVFDEVDTAVGGAVADAIGARLARLSSGVQVLSVTHAPQVAARANAHLLVAKAAASKGKSVRTDVTPLSDNTRREEIARMLAGATVTDEARAAADRLILGAA